MIKNKKILLFMFLLLFLVTPIFASFKNFVLKTGNDLWTHGISYNNDDQLTYSIGSDINFDDVSISFDLNSYTSRSTERRIDLLTILAYYSHITDHAELRAGFGLAFSGNLGGEKLQNLLHSVLKVPELSLYYSYPAYSYPVGSFDMKFSFDIFTEPYIYSKIDIIFGLSSSVKAGIGFNLDLLNVNVGYTWISESTDPAFDDYVNKKNGLTVGYTIDKGILKMVYEVNPMTRLGYTSIIISPLTESEFSFASYSVGKIYSFKDYKTVDSFEVKLNNYLAFTRVKTGFNAERTARIEEPQFGLGYDFNYTFKEPSIISIHAKPYLYYAYYDERSSETDTITHTFGGGVEGAVSIKPSSYYSIQLFGGTSYTYLKGFDPYVGLQVYIL